VPKDNKWLPDKLWKRVEPLLPKPKKRRRQYPGRKRLDDRKVLTAIIFVLRTGIAWRELPPELGCGSGMTCLRRLREWQRRGVFQKLYELLLAELNGSDKLDWSRAIADSASGRAPGGGEKTGPSPVDRRKLGSKVHVLVDAKGIPLAIRLTGANSHDITQLIPLVDDIPKVKGKKRKTAKQA
jgi:transposase